VGKDDKSASFLREIMGMMGGNNTLSPNNQKIADHLSNSFESNNNIDDSEESSWKNKLDP